MYKKLFYAKASNTTCISAKSKKLITLITVIKTSLQNKHVTKSVTIKLHNIKICNLHYKYLSNPAIFHRALQKERHDSRFYRHIDLSSVAH